MHKLITATLLTVGALVVVATPAMAQETSSGGAL